MSSRLCRSPDGICHPCRPCRRRRIFHCAHSCLCISGCCRPLCGTCCPLLAIPVVVTFGFVVLRLRDGSVVASRRGQSDQRSRGPRGESLHEGAARGRVSDSFGDVVETTVVHRTFLLCLPCPARAGASHRRSITGFERSADWSKSARPGAPPSIAGCRLAGRTFGGTAPGTGAAPRIGPSPVTAAPRRRKQQAACLVWWRDYGQRGGNRHWDVMRSGDADSRKHNPR